MKKTYLLGSLILSILAIAVVVTTLSIFGVMGTDEKIPLVFSTESQVKTYDGTPLENESWKLLSGELKKGHTVVATVSGTQTNAGFSDNSLSVKIIDENMADVTEDYRIEYSLGKLTVLQRDIQIASDSASKLYDGTPLTCKSYKIVNGRLLTGHRLDVSFGMSRTDVGVTENIMDIRIVDKTNMDVTANYKIDALNGNLHISGYPLTIKTLSDEKVYDGTPLTKEKYEMLGELQEGHDISVVVSGSQTVAGESKNEATIKIVDTEKNVDVTNQYDINLILGTLTVFKREISVSTANKSVTYAEIYEKGGELKCESYTISDGLAPGHKESVVVTGSVVGVGKTTNTCLVEIYDANGMPVTQNYNITKECGELQVLPVDIVISSKDAYISYDDYVKGGKTPLTCSDYDKSVATLLDGHEIVIEFTGVQRVPGKSRNYFDVAVVEKNNKNNNVSDLYEIECIFGTLEIGKIDLVLGSTEGIKEYDGTELKKNGEGDWWIVSGELYTDHEIVLATMDTSLTNVGRQMNDVFLTIHDENGIDVTSYYNIIKSELGYLEITPLSLFVTAEGYSDMYNGEMVQPGVYHITGGYDELLAREHRIDIGFTQFPSEVGTYKNELAIVIYDSEGHEITQNYAIKRTEYDIVITPRIVTVRTDSDSKLYDGTPLTAPGWKIVSETMPVEGHELVVVVSGERTEIGSSPNEIAELRVIVKETERDVSYNYDLSGVQIGVLTVKDPSSNNGPQLPTDPTSPPGEFDGEMVLLAKIKSSTTGPVYLREMSFGNYNGQGFDLASSYPVCIDNKYSMSYLTALSLGKTTEKTQRMDIEYLSTRYFLPYYLDVEEAGYTEQRSDVYYDDPDCVSAALYYYDYWYSSDNPLPAVPDEYKGMEEKYREYVYNTYLSMEGFSKTKAYLKSVINEEGFNKNDPEILDKVATYIQNCATYNLEYDRYLDAENDVVLSFMTEYGEGVCRHYAMAATLMLRTLGIPARYTVGVYSEIEEVNEWTEVYSNTGHAWTEAYIDGVGWVALEVTGGDLEFPGTGGGGGGGGGGGSGAIKVEITPRVDPMKYYDGVVLTATKENTKLSGNDNFNDLVKAGYTFKFEVEGSISQVGYAPVNITSIKMFSPGGEDLTDSEDYEIVLNEGRLHMYESELTVQSFDANSDYTGDYVTNTRYWHSPLLSDKHYLEISFGNGRKDAGQSQNYFSCRVYEDIDGVKTDVTYRYLVEKTFGTITVNHIKITLTADSTQMSYSDLVEIYGGSYTASAYTLEGELHSGHHISEIWYDDEKEQNISNRIRLETTIDGVVIVDEYGNDVTHNYIITLKKGLIRIK